MQQNSCLYSCSKRLTDICRRSPLQKEVTDLKDRIRRLKASSDSAAAEQVPEHTTLNVFCHLKPNLVYELSTDVHFLLLDY